MATSPLLGRDRELRTLADLVDGAHERGGALVLRGEAGIGKSALLSAAGERARERGMLVLSAAGVQSETHLPFAGLHQLLRPILAGLDELPSPQRAAVQAAFGITDAAAPNLFLVALATLNLLGDAAAGVPIVLLVDDAQWLDRPSGDVLAFVARRLAADPIVLLAAVRDGFEIPLADAGGMDVWLEGLDPAAAGALLDAHAPHLPAAVRARLLDEAAGNPLALVELRAALGSEQLSGAAPLPAWLPLTTRLERAFAVRLSELPDAARRLLLIAAVDDGDDLQEVLRAGAVLLGDVTFAADALEPAVGARLVEADEARLRFRHPLVRSAIHQAASNPQRLAAHAALATVLIDQPDRRAWHLAASTVGADEAVAGEIEAAASRAQRRGAIAVAVAGLERAARLSSEGGDKGGRLLRAAELALESGRQALVARFVREAESLVRTDLHQGRYAWIKEIVDPGPQGDPAAVYALVETAARVRDAGDTDLATRLLLAAAGRCSFADPGDAAREAVVAAAEQFRWSDDDPRLLAILMSTAPVSRGRIVLDRLARTSFDPGGDPEAMQWVADAAVNAGAHDLAPRWYAAAVGGLRAQGRLALLARALVAGAWADATLGRCTAAMPAAEEGSRLAQETGQLLWLGRGRATQALLAGLCGDEDAVASFAAEAENIAHPARVTTILGALRWARGLTAIGARRYDAAYDQLRTLFDTADPAGPYARRSAAIGDLAEAALHSGHREEVRSMMSGLERYAARTHSPWTHVGMRHARALLAEDEQADALFQAALGPDVAGWPFARARAQLAYGSWLRRNRRIAESRPQLRAARDTFDELGLLPWADRARQELRASGEMSGPRTPAAHDQLTPQEIQIALMAAEGHSNREIGSRLYLSHRTVSTHLYRIFPKLGVTTRTELRTALDAGADSPA